VNNNGQEAVISPVLLHAGGPGNNLYSRANLSVCPVNSVQEILELSSAGNWGPYWSRISWFTPHLQSRSKISDHLGV